MTELLKCLTLISLIFVEFQLNIKGTNVAYVQIAAGLTLCYILYSFMRKGQWKEFAFSKLLKKAYIIYFIGFIGIIIYHSSGSISEVVKYTLVLIAMLVIFLSFYFNYKDEESWIKYFNFLFIVAAFIIIFGIFETYKVDIFPKRFDSYFWGISNRVASRLLLLIPPAFYLAKYKDKKYYVPFFLLVFGVVMTVSRGAMIVLGLFLLLNIAELFRGKNKFRTLAAAGIIIVGNSILKIMQSWLYRSEILGLQIGFELHSSGTGKSAAEGNPNAISRLTLWKDAVRDFVHHPIAGKGIDKFNSFYMYYDKKVTEVNAHNWILHILSEVGIVGLLFTLVLILAIFTVLYKRYRYSIETNDNNMKILTLSAGGSTAVFLTHNLMEASSTSLMFGYGSVTVILVIILGIALGYKKETYRGSGK